MNPSDFAVLVIGVVSLVNVGATYKLHMKALEKMGDRLRLVNPVKPPAQDKPDVAAKTPEAEKPPVSLAGAA